MEKQKRSTNQKQSAALERVYSDCLQGNEPSFIVDGLIVYVYSTKFAISKFDIELERIGLTYRVSGECIFVFSLLFGEVVIFFSDNLSLEFQLSFIIFSFMNPYCIEETEDGKISMETDYGTIIYENSYLEIWFLFTG